MRRSTPCLPRKLQILCQLEEYKKTHRQKYEHDQIPWSEPKRTCTAEPLNLNEVEKNAIPIHENRYETLLDEPVYTQSTSDNELEDERFDPSPQDHTELHDKTNRILLIGDSKGISR